MRTKISPREIPIIVKLGDLCKIGSLAHKAMVAIHEGRSNDAFNIIKEMFDINDSIIEASVDREMLSQFMEKAERESNIYN